MWKREIENIWIRVVNIGYQLSKLESWSSCKCQNHLTSSINTLLRSWICATREYVYAILTFDGIKVRRYYQMHLLNRWKTLFVFYFFFFRSDYFLNYLAYVFCSILFYLSILMIFKIIWKLLGKLREAN